MQSIIGEGAILKTYSRRPPPIPPARCSCLSFCLKSYSKLQNVFSSVAILWRLVCTPHSHAYPEKSRYPGFTATPNARTFVPICEHRYLRREIVWQMSNQGAWPQMSCIPVDPVRIFSVRSRGKESGMSFCSKEHPRYRDWTQGINDDNP